MIRNDYQQDTLPRGMTVLYDGRCGFCLQLRRWAERQPATLPIRFLPQQHPETSRRFPGLCFAQDRLGRPSELVVVDPAGEVHRDTEAYLAILSAMCRYERLARQMLRPAMRPLVRRFFKLAATQRHRLSALLHLKPEPLEHALRQVDEPVCVFQPDAPRTRRLRCN